MPNRQDGLHAAFRAGPSVNVVPEEHDAVVAGDLRLQPVEEILQGPEMAVYVADDKGGHRKEAAQSDTRPRVVRFKNYRRTGTGEAVSGHSGGPTPPWP